MSILNIDRSMKSADRVLTMLVGNAFSESRIRTLSNKTTLTIIKITVADAQASWVACASADMISTIWVDFVFTISDVKIVRNNTTWTIVNTTATDVQKNCVPRASAVTELPMRVGNVFFDSRIMALRSKTTLTIINRHDVDHLGLPYILWIKVHYAFSVEFCYGGVSLDPTLANSQIKCFYVWHDSHVNKMLLWYFYQRYVYYISPSFIWQSFPDVANSNYKRSLVIGCDCLSSPVFIERPVIRQCFLACMLAPLHR